MGMRVVELTLPWPPALSHYYRRVRGRTFLSPAAREYLEGTTALIRAAGKRLRPPYRVQVAAFPPDRRRRDLDNLLKPVLDCLRRGGLIQDDHLVHELEARFGSPVEDGALWVRVTSLEARSGTM